MSTDSHSQSESNRSRSPSPDGLSPRLLVQYNEQYSLFTREVSAFLRECRISMIGILEPGPSKSLLSIAQKHLTVIETKLGVKKPTLAEFQTRFEHLLNRMRVLIEDLFSFEVKFKEGYLLKAKTECSTGNTNSNENNRWRGKFVEAQQWSQENQGFNWDDLSARLNPFQVSRKESSPGTRDMGDSTKTPYLRKFGKVFNQQSSEDVNLASLTNKLEAMRSEVSSFCLKERVMFGKGRSDQQNTITTAANTQGRLRLKSPYTRQPWRVLSPQHFASPSKRS